ncbi:MAG: uncharacterized protein QOF91_2827 [Alphaproteobacteria bacterium]|jgi:predicted TIM-barrel fold metal-dependent hydrolase|nr:uncharacterized protein [Alphaproteobacteria bacterium]MEA3027542.1 uncharacterized protein [Alphaproteobacteria bacterium]
MNQVDPPKSRKVRLSENFHTGDLLANARRQARDRKFDDYLIVDVDAHHNEFDHWSEIAKYIDNRVIRHLASVSPNPSTILSAPPTTQDMGDRIGRRIHRKLEHTPEGRHREISLTLRYMDAIGIDYTILFPSPMLLLGQHPLVDIEVAMARAYNRWLVENVLAVEPRIKSMLYLPFNDPEASLKMVEEFGDKPGVMGFMVVAIHFKPVHDKAYMKLYAALEERGLPIAFHASYYWEEQSARQMNKFLSVHALTFPYYLMVHLTNWIVNGIPELFPKLRVSWIEGGVAYLPFIMMRLDHEYMMRISEAPLLKRMPSDYIREMYFTSQPLECPGNPNLLKPIFEMVNADKQMMYSSDYPHWDFDVPSRLFDLKFLTPEARRNILGLNACRYFGVDPAKMPVVKPKTGRIER